MVVHGFSIQLWDGGGDDTDRAEVTLVVAITGSAISGPEELAGLHADVYKIDMDLDDEGDGDWRLVWAQWRSTAPTDLI